MSKREKFYEWFDNNCFDGTNEIIDYVMELEDLLKECVIDKDILKYSNMKLESDKLNLIKCLKRCDQDVARINEHLADMGFHPYTLMEKDIKEVLKKFEVKNGKN